MQLALEQHRERLNNESHAEGAMRDAKQRTDMQLAIREESAAAEQRIETRMRAAFVAAHSDTRIQIQRHAESQAQSEARMSARIDELSSRVDGILANAANTRDTSAAPDDKARIDELSPQVPGLLASHIIPEPSEQFSTHTTDVIHDRIAACIAEATRQFQAVTEGNIQRRPHGATSPRDVNTKKSLPEPMCGARDRAGKRRSTRIARIVEELQNDRRARADARILTANGKNK
jgi:hypothetical protein